MTTSTDAGKEIVVERAAASFACRNCGKGEMNSLEAQLHRCNMEGVAKMAGIAERARIVAWLLKYPSVIGLSEMAAWNVAACIERGDHITTGQEEGA